MLKMLAGALGALALLLFHQSAEAAGGKAAGDACAQKLPPESKLIYEATVKNLGSAATIKDVVSTQTRALVMQGKVQMSTAKTSAEATAPCLELVAKG